MARQLSSYFGIMLVICLMAMATGIACSSGTESAGDNAATESQETAVATEAAAAVEKVADEAKEVVSTEAAAAVEKAADEAKEVVSTEAAAEQPGNIGVWGDTSSRTSWRLVIYEKDGKVFVDQTFPNGKTQLLEVAESEVPAGRKFAALDASQASTYWVLDSQGKLQIYNKEGLITTINPLK